VPEHDRDAAAFEELGAAGSAEHALGATRIRITSTEPSAHVWRVPLHSGEHDLPSFVTVLSTDERERMARCHREADRRRYAIAHGALRLLLARYLGQDPHDLVFATGTHGKPRLASAPAIEFNLTHSGDLALIALARNRAVGVDIESLGRKGFDMPALARRVLCPREHEWLFRIEEHSRVHAFLRLWSCKEAISKAAGAGFAAGFAHIETDPDALFSARSQQLRAAGGYWRLHILEPDDGYVGALAVAAEPAGSS
jgi:4'-phosphopantetheinyl transferase